MYEGFENIPQAFIDLFLGKNIGKAVIKMHIQKLFVILAFNEGLLEQSISLLRKIPVVGESNDYATYPCHRINILQQVN